MDLFLWMPAWDCRSAGYVTWAGREEELRVETLSQGLSGNTCTLNLVSHCPTRTFTLASSCLSPLPLSVSDVFKRFLGALLCGEHWGRAAGGGGSGHWAARKTHTALCGSVAHTNLTEDLEGTVCPVGGKTNFPPNSGGEVSPDDIQ